MAFNPLRENDPAPWAVSRGCELPEVVVWGCRLALSDRDSNTRALAWKKNTHGKELLMPVI